MMTLETLTDLLACPKTKQKLNLATANYLQSVNTAVSDGSLMNVEGKQVTKTISAGLLREDKKVLYPIVNNIPVLLAEEGLDVSVLDFNMPNG